MGVGAGVEGMAGTGGTMGVVEACRGQGKVCGSVTAFDATRTQGQARDTVSYSSTPPSKCGSLPGLSVFRGIICYYLQLPREPQTALAARGFWGCQRNCQNSHDLLANRLRENYFENLRLQLRFLKMGTTGL